MKALHQYVGILLVSVVLGYPAMACLTLGVEMTTAERECCKQMAQNCGSMNMPASHSCCQTEVRQPQPMLQAAAAHVAPQVATEAAVIQLENPFTSHAEFSFELHPPPESSPGSSSILRI